MPAQSEINAMLTDAGFALQSMQGDDGTSGQHLGDDGYADYFGWNPLKAVSNAVKSVAKVATAPARAVVGTVSDIAHGKNVIKTIGKQGGALVKSGLEGAKIVGNVASFIPGLGTGVSFAIKFTGSVGEAVAAGKNVLASAKGAAINAALNSLPGGDLTGKLIKTAANVAAAGLQGQNVLKSAAHELVGAAVAMVPGTAAQQILTAAADAALQGKNVLEGASAAAIKAAVAQIPDANARTVVMNALQGKPPANVVQGANAALLAKAAGAMPTGGAATLVTGITGKNPDQIHAAITAPVRPTPAKPVMSAAFQAAALKRQQDAAALLKRQAENAAKIESAARSAMLAAPSAAEGQRAAARAAEAMRASLAPHPAAVAPVAVVRAPITAPAAPADNLPPIPFGGRRVLNIFGPRRIVHDISPQGHVATYVT
jgi:hypothetical protein